MNNCILMAEIVQDPQLRYTSDTQVPVAEMLVQIDPVRDGDPPATLKVVAWRKLAEAVQENYRRGDRAILEGRLGMVLVDRPEGFREKRAEMTIQRIHTLGEPSGVASGAATSAPAAAPMTPPAPVSPSVQPTTTSTPVAPAPTPAPPAPQPASPPDELANDDIPF